MIQTVDLFPYYFFQIHFSIAFSQRKTFFDFHVRTFWLEDLEDWERKIWKFQKMSQFKSPTLGSSQTLFSDDL